MRYCFGRFSYRRLAGRLRRDLPIFPFLVLVLSGQAVAAVTGETGTLCAAAAGVLLSFAFRSIPWRKLLPFLIGMASVLVSRPEVLPEFSSQISITARVAGQIRRAEPGALQFKAVIEEAPHGYSTLAGHRVLMKGRDLPWFNLSGIREGASGIFKVRCRNAGEASNPFSWEATLLRHGISMICTVYYAAPVTALRPGFVSTVRDAAYQLVVESSSNDEDAGLLLSMFLGIQDSLGDATESAFKRTGLMHILVVSGYQVTLFYYFIYSISFFILTRLRILSLLFPARTLAHCAGLSASLFYVLITGAEAAVVRAAVAIVILVCGILLERPGRLLHTIFVTLLIVSLMTPGAIFEPGTELTFAALFGIALGARRGDSIGVQYLRTCFYGSLFTSLVSVCWFGIFSPAAFLLNPLLVAPVSAFICKGGALALLLLWSGAGGGQFVLYVLLRVLHVFKLTVLLTAGIPLAYLECSITWRIITALVLAGFLVYRMFSEAAGELRYQAQEERNHPQAA